MSDIREYSQLVRALQHLIRETELGDLQLGNVFRYNKKTGKLEPLIVAHALGCIRGALYLHSVKESKINEEE
jgi:hypothetical protein